MKKYFKNYRFKTNIATKLRCLFHELKPVSGPAEGEGLGGLQPLHFFGNFKELGMGRTYAKFLFSTADFQVKFYAGRFCAKIFLSSLQSHWLSRIFYANSALSITANII